MRLKIGSVVVTMALGAALVSTRGVQGAPKAEARGLQGVQAAPRAQGQSAQGRHEHSENDPFIGSWKINRERSKQTTGEPPLIENITIRIEHGVEHYTVEVQNVGEPQARKNRYEAKYNDGKWYPYVNQLTGEAASEVMMVKTDPRTEYRFMRPKGGGPTTGVLMRRMAEDGKSYVSTMLNLAGEVTLARVFERR